MTNILKRKKILLSSHAQARLERAAGLAQGAVTREEAGRFRTTKEHT